MRNLRFVIVGIVVLLLTSCNAVSSRIRNANSLVLKLDIAQKQVASLNELQPQVQLRNNSNSSILVHTRLYDLPFLMPSTSAELLVLISDSSGNFIYNSRYFPNYQLPGDDTLNILKPGESITKNIINLEIKFGKNMFRKGEKYTIVAVYQNDFDVTKNLMEGKVSSWVGSVRSNEEYFFILR